MGQQPEHIGQGHLSSTGKCRPYRREACSSLAAKPRSLLRSRLVADPVAGQVADNLARGTLRRHLWIDFLQLCLQLRQHQQAVLLSAFVAMFIADFI